MACAAAPSRRCVYQFHHLGEAGTALSSTAPAFLQGCFFCGAGAFAGGVWVFCAGGAAPPVAGAGAVWPVGSAGWVELFSAFFFAASCAAMFLRARSTESLCEERQASVSEVIMKTMAQIAVTLLRNVTDPRPPKTVLAEPPPPAKAAIASPFPGCSRMTKMRKTLTMTWMVMMKANMRAARITRGSGPGKQGASARERPPGG